MSNAIQRFLGFAFASADLLLELAPEGSVVFAAGAVHAVTGLSEAEIAGKAWRSLVAHADQAMVEAMLDTLEGGVRRGPVNVLLAPTADQERRTAAFCACRLPGSQNVSCALSLAAGLSAAGGVEVDASGLQSRASFEDMAEDLLAAAKIVGQELDFALIEAPGLSSALEAAGADAAGEIVTRLSGALRAESFGGAPAARVGPERFALIRSKGTGSDQIVQRLGMVLAAATDGRSLESRSRILGLDANGESLERSMRALRYAMDQFVAHGIDAKGASSLTEAFNQSLQATLARAGAMGEAIRAQSFNLAYQPIVDLKTGKVQHYEALLRFTAEASPYDLVRLAEELALIEQLDLAVASKVFAKVHAERDKDLHLAVNMSGRSIEDTAFVAEFRRITAHQPDLIRRLVIEVTESAQIRDLKTANRNIQRLRADGHVLCLDDFGAGASSMAYLQALQVDIVKIDGRYIKELAGDGPEAALVRHVVALCRELGVTTIAEMIETEAVEDAVRRAGVDFGQGYLYGKPADQPKPPVPRAAPALARRKGAVETWG